MKLRDTEKSCGRSLLLSLFIASSIQQGGASEPGVQPGQAGGLCEAGRDGREWRMEVCGMDDAVEAEEEMADCWSEGRYERSACFRVMLSSSADRHTAMSEEGDGGPVQSSH